MVLITRTGVGPASPGKGLTRPCVRVWLAAALAATPITAQQTDVVPWLGFALSCTECSPWRPDFGGRTGLVFRTSPTVHLLDPGGPAARAGLREGDVLIQINGLALTSPEGQRLLEAVAAGDTVQISYRRGDDAAEATLVVGGVRRSALTKAEGTGAGAPLLYSGSLGREDVLVFGGDRVQVGEAPGEIVIDAGEGRVRVMGAGRVTTHDGLDELVIDIEGGRLLVTGPGRVSLGTTPGEVTVTFGETRIVIRRSP